MKKRLFAFILTTVMLLSITALSVSAYITIESGDSVILWNPGEPPYISLEKEKVYQNEYTQEELSAYVNASLAQMRLQGELILRCPTDDAEATAVQLNDLLGVQVTFSHTVGDTNIAVYTAVLEEAILQEKMLALLQAGIYASPNSVDFPPECAPFLCGDINTSGEVDATDYMMVKRIVLGTYMVSEERATLADINGDGETDLADYMMVKRYVLGTYEITRGAIIDWINS